jgi:hypothetical protein
MRPVFVSVYLSALARPARGAKVAHSRAGTFPIQPEGLVRNRPSKAQKTP